MTGQHGDGVKLRTPTKSFPQLSWCNRPRHNGSLCRSLTSKRGSVRTQAKKYRKEGPRLHCAPLWFCYGAYGARALINPIAFGLPQPVTKSYPTWAE